MNNIEKANYIFTQTLHKNEKFLENTLNFDEEIKEILFRVVDTETGINFMNCLLNHYTNNEIMDLFNSINSKESQIVMDAMKVFRELPTYTIEEDFQKVNNRFHKLYTEFSRLKQEEEIYWVKEKRKRIYSAIVNNPEYIPDDLS